MWRNERLRGSGPWPWAGDDPGTFFGVDSAAALGRIAAHVVRTPLVPLPSAPRSSAPGSSAPGSSAPGAAGPGLEVLGKMENRQVTGSFKARGALNSVALMTDEERARGVVASSSGNHGRALAWAAARAGVPATIVMPEFSYPNKIEACRAEGAEVVLTATRPEADRVAAELASPAGGGKLWVHPYDRPSTIEGAGTVGVEIAADAEGLDAVVVCVGGGGLSAGTALALRRALGPAVALLGAEPVGADTMTRGLRAGESVAIDVTSAVQGINTPHAGAHNIAVNAACLDAMAPLEDGAILEAQRILVNEDPARGWTGEVVEPAGAAAYALTRDPRFDGLVRAILGDRGLERDPARPLRVAVTISGGNPDPAQLASLRC